MKDIAYKIVKSFSSNDLYKMNKNYTYFVLVSKSDKDSSRNNYKLNLLGQFKEDLILLIKNINQFIIDDIDLYYNDEYVIDYNYSSEDDDLRIFFFKNIDLIYIITIKRR